MSNTFRTSTLAFAVSMALGTVSVRAAEGDKTKVGDKAKAKEDQKKEDKAPPEKK